MIAHSLILIIAELLQLHLGFLEKYCYLTASLVQPVASIKFHPMSFLTPYITKA